MKRLLGWIGGVLLIGFVLVRLLLPDPLAHAMARGLARLMARLVPSRRRIALRNLRRAFGASRTDTELRRLLRDSYALMAVSFSDLLPLFRLTRARYCERIRVDGREHLTVAQGAGKGVILVSAHYGAFPMLAPAVCNLEVDFHLLYRLPTSGPVRALFNRWLGRSGVVVIEDAPRHTAALRCLEALGRGAAVCLLVDQHFPAGIEVPFFGRPAKTGVGAALLAARSGAPLVPIRLVRRPDGGYRLIIEPALPPPASRSREDLTACTAALTARVEAWIRESPEPWFWIHRRWKDLDRMEDAARA